MQDFRKLLVWQRAQALAVSVHRIQGPLTGSGFATLRNQLRRSAMSMAANISEGAAKGTPRHFAQYLETAIGSASETESHLDFAQRIGALDLKDAELLMRETVEIRRMLIVLRRRVLETGGEKSAS